MQGYSRNLKPQYPDSATTSTGSCIDSFLSEKLLAVIYSNDYTLYWAQSIVTFSCWFFKGGATLQCLQSYLHQHNIGIYSIYNIFNNCSLRPYFLTGLRIRTKQHIIICVVLNSEYTVLYKPNDILFDTQKITFAQCNAYMSGSVNCC